MHAVRGVGEEREVESGIIIYPSPTKIHPLDDHLAPDLFVTNNA